MASGPWDSYKPADVPTETPQESATVGPWATYAKEAPAEPEQGPWSAYAKPTQPAREKPTPYKDRREALDDAVNLLEEGVSPQDVTTIFGKAGIKWPEIQAFGTKRGSEFFKRQEPGEVPPLPAQAVTGEIRPVQETKFAEHPIDWATESIEGVLRRTKSTYSDAATSILAQTGAIKPEDAAFLLARNAKEKEKYAYSEDIKEGMRKIGGATTFGGAATEMAANPRATFTLLVDSIAASLPAMAPAMVLGPAGAIPRMAATFAGSGGLEFGSSMADVLQDAGVNLLDAYEISKALKDPDIMNKIRDVGVKRGLTIGAVDAATMGFAGRFLRPAMQLIRAGELTGNAAKKATIGAWSKELALQMAGGGGGEYAAQRLTGQNKPADVLAEMLAEGVSAPAEVLSNLREAKKAERAAGIEAAELPPEEPETAEAVRTARRERVEPTLTFPEEAEEARPSTEEVKAARDARLKDIAATFEQRGIPADDAMTMAEGRLSALEDREGRAKEKEAETTMAGMMGAPVPAAPVARVEELTQAFIDAGLPPKEAVYRATIIAQDEAESDAAAAKTEAAPPAEGAPSATRPIGEGVGVGVPVAERPSTVGRAETAEEAERRGVVSTGEAAGVPAARETAQPAAVTPEAKQLLDAVDAGGVPAMMTNNLKRVAADNGIAVTPTDTPNTVVEQLRTKRDQGEEVGIETPEAVKAEEKGPEVPAITGAAEEPVATAAESTEPAAKRGRGRPALTPEQKDAAEEARRQQRLASNAAARNVSNAEKALTNSLTPLEASNFADEKEFNEAVDDQRRARQSAVRTLYDISRANKNKPGQRAAELLKNSAIPEGDVRAAQESYDLRKKHGLVSSAEVGGKAAEVANPEFVKGQNAVQAAGVIIKTGTRLQKFFASRIRPFLTDVGFVIVEQGDPLPKELQNHKADWERSRGMFIYNPLTKTRNVYVRGSSFGLDQGVNNVIVLHELLHAAINRKIEIVQQTLTRGVYTKTKLTKAYTDLVQIMNNALTRYNDMVDADEVPPQLTEIIRKGKVFNDPREFVTYGLSNDTFKDFLASAKGGVSSDSFLTRFVKNIMDFFGWGPETQNALRDLVMVSDKLLSTRAPAGMQAFARAMDAADILRQQLRPYTKPSAAAKEKAFEGTERTVAPSANVKRLTEMLGSKLYGTPQDIATVSLKELFQNSFDAVKESLEKGQEKIGHIYISTNDAKRTITIIDDGPGMPASVMGNQFLQIAGTVKGTSRPSGGLGIAKMLFLFENERLEVVSLRDGELARMETTGKDLKASFGEDTSRQPVLTTTTDPDRIKKYLRENNKLATRFADGHGTAITIQIPETYVDTSTGETKNIRFDSYDLEFSSVLKYSPLFDDVSVEFDRGGYGSTLPIGENFPAKDYTPLANVNFDWGTARIYVSKEPFTDWQDHNTHILSNGLWQFDADILDSFGYNAKKIKRVFYVDVSPKASVTPESPAYPFDMNRQRFSFAADGDFKKIFNYLTVLYSQLNFSKDVKNFGAVQYINPNGTLTAPELLEPKAPPSDTAFTLIKEGDTVEIRDGVMYVNNRQVPDISPEDLKKTTIRIDELTIPQDEIDPNKVMVHDNVYLKGTQKTLSEAAKEKFGDSYNKYLAGIGDIFMLLRDALAADKSGDFSKLRDEAIGTSLDMKYYGVNTALPFRGMFINPASTAHTESPRHIATSMIGTMAHELAHHRQRNHSEKFISEMQHVLLTLELSPFLDLAHVKNNLTNHIARYQSIFDFLHREFSHGNLEPRGNRFKDAGTFQERYAGAAGSMEGAGPAGEGGRPGVPGGFEPSYQRIEKGAVSPTASESAKKAGADARKLEKEVDIIIEKIRISRQGQELAKDANLLQALRDPRKVGPYFQRVWSGLKYGQRKAIAALMTTDFLVQVAGENVPELRRTNVLLQEMAGMTQQLLRAGGDVANSIHRAFVKDPSLRIKLEDTALATTLAEYDPSDTSLTVRNQKLDKMYEELGPDGQKAYKMVRDFYDDMADYYAKLLYDQISSLRIDINTRENLVKKLRQIFETEKRIRPYFGLVRYGDFWLRVGQGKHRQFFMFETRAERDAAAQGFAKERRISLEELLDDRTFEIGNDVRQLRAASYDSSQLLQGVFDALDKTTFSDPDARDELEDSIYQLYLSTMPEGTFRKQFITREGITGFNPDILRNFSHTAAKMSTQLSRVKYGPLLRNSISQAQDSIVGREEFDPYVAEMRNRVKDSLAPPMPDPAMKVAGMLNKASFIWYLSGWSSALIQPISILMTGWPVLTQYGIANASTELSKMLKVWNQFGVKRHNIDGTTSWVAPSVELASGLTPEERRAVNEMLGRDVTQSTMTKALYGYKSMPTEKYKSKYEATKRFVDVLIGGLTHTTERLSREIIFVTSFRLNRKAGRSIEDSVNRAVIDTNEALGNYGAHNRPMIMRGAVGKIALQFTMYPLHVALFLLNNFRHMLPMFNREGKADAAKKFFGTLGMTFLFTGVKGLPLYSSVIGLLGWAWKEFSKDKDWPEELKELSYDVWFRTVFLPELLGNIKIGGKELSDIIERGVANALTGVDISSRASLNDMWWRETKETKTAREGALAFAMEHAGPSASMILSLADAYDAGMNGDYRKMIEKASPAFLRNLAIVDRYREEGAQNAAGAQILDPNDFTTGELIGQAVGFRPDILANTQAVTFKLASAEQKIVNQRSNLLRRINFEFRQGNEKKFESLIEKDLAEFNSKYPAFGIDDDQLYDSLVTQAERRATSRMGLPITEKNVGFADPALAALERKLEARRKEREKK